MDDHEQDDEIEEDQDDVDEIGSSSSNDFDSNFESQEFYGNYF